MLRTLLITILLGTTTGCVAAAAAAAGGAAGVFYVRGEYAGFVEAAPDRVVDATEATLKSMGYTIRKTTREPAAGEVVAVTESKDRVAVSIEAQPSGLTRLGIRVGIFGDEALSQDIFRRVLDRL